jgi:hypothetical protein
MQHLTEPEMHAYRDRTLAAESLLRATGHIAECEECRRKLRLLAAPGRAIAELSNPPETHLSGDALQRFVDGELNEGERIEIEQHLEQCSECRTDVASLRQFASTWKKPSRRWLAVAAGVIVAAGIGIGLWIERPNVVVALQDGSRNVTLDSRGNISGAGSLTPEQTASVRRILLGGALETPSILAKLKPPTGALMGSSPAPAFHLETPVGTAVSTPRPVFRWTSWAPGAVYVVTLKNMKSGEVVSTPPIPTLEWMPSQPLRTGSMYEWQVAATLNGHEQIVPSPPSPPARFQVLDDTQYIQLAHLPESHLARAILYAEAGLLDDATQEAKTLTASNPASTTTTELLRRIESLRQPR